MSQDWMIDVLKDIRQFARTNRFPGLAEVLDDAIMVAAVEIRDRGAIAEAVERHDVEVGECHRGYEEHSFS